MSNRRVHRNDPGRPRHGAPRRRATDHPTVFEISAGGVVYRRTPRGLDVCLIATTGGTRWQLPKGKQEKGEAIEDTAVREVAEETGLVTRLGPRLDKVDLWFSRPTGGALVRHHKLVYFFLLEYLRGDTRDHDAEVDDARWFPAPEALERLTFPSERRVVMLALEMLDAWPPPRSTR